jgi:hypothetical protein
LVILQEKMAGVIFSGLAKMTLATFSLFSRAERPERPSSTPRRRLEDQVQSNLELAPIPRQRGSQPIGPIRGELVEPEVGISSQPRHRAPVVKIVGLKDAVPQARV